MQELQTRLRLLQAKHADKIGSGVCNVPDSVRADVIKLYNEAIDSRYLPQNINITFIDGETISVEGYQLYTIEKYNRIANQLTTLIDVTSNLDCVVTE